MNLPNRLTSYRIVLAVIFMCLLFSQGVLAKVFALLTFGLASFTDYWDGKIARERNQVTDFGRLMDPIADKILTFSAFITFVQMGIIPAWMVVVIVSRDLLITGYRLTIPKNHSGKAPGRSGKHKTVLQLASILGVLIFLIAKETSYWQEHWTESAECFIYISMCFIVLITLWSAIHYVMQHEKGRFKT